MKKTPLVIANVIVFSAVAVLITLNREDENDAAENTSPLPARSTGEAHRDAPPTRSPQEGLGNHRTPRDDDRQWTKRIDALLGDSQISTDQAARDLLFIAATRNAPVSTRNDALEHALNLLDENDYAAISPLLDSTNDLPDMLAQTLLDESLNQSATYQVKVALAVLRLKPGSELADEAVELLEFQIGAAHGVDLQQWQSAVDHFIAKQPE